METFIKKNELGIGFECAIISKIEIDDGEYVVYTDFVTINEERLRVYAGKLVDGKVIDIDKDLEYKILSDYENEEKNYYKRIMEEMV